MSCGSLRRTLRQDLCLKPCSKNFFRAQFDQILQLGIRSNSRRGEVLLQSFGVSAGFNGFSRDSHQKKALVQRVQRRIELFPRHREKAKSLRKRFVSPGSLFSEPDTKIEQSRNSVKSEL